LEQSAVAKDRVLYAHRGASLKLPENTMEAFRQGLQDGATALEMDVQCTEDDMVVVFHDEDGFRTATQPDVIAETSSAVIKTWNVGAGLFPSSVQRHFTGHKYHVPEFAEVLDAFSNVQLNVDIKTSDTTKVATVIDVIRRHKATSRVLLTSFFLPIVNAVRGLGYEGQIGLSRWEVAALFFVPERYVGQFLRGKGHRVQVPLKYGPLQFDEQSFIDKCHRLGLKIDFWTINQRDVAKELLRKGADGIMSDDPANLFPAFAPYFT